MKDLSNKFTLISSIFLLLQLGNVFSQNVPQGLTYQTTVRNNSGVVITNQTVHFQFSIYSNSPAGTLVWQENHLINTDFYGHLKTIIGTGISTGAGAVSAFYLINWSTGVYYLKVSLDPTGGSTFTDMGESQLLSVPYSLYALKTNALYQISLGQLIDVNLAGNIPGHLLKWNGSYWISALDNDSDTVLFAYNAISATASDTALYVYGALTSDTTLFAFQTDSTGYASNSGNVVNSSNANYSDTATYAFVSGPSAWTTTGNSPVLSNFIGTTDSNDLNFKTNSTNRFIIKSSGNVNIGNSLNNASLSLKGDDGLFAIGVLTSVNSPVSGAGTKMIWNPSKASFRAGSINSNEWDTVNVGEYSIAFGSNTKSRVRSFSSGSDCESVDYSFSAGRKCKAMAVGPYPEGSSIALGDSCVSMDYRDVTIGKNNYTSGAINILIGNNNSVASTQSVCIGSYCSAFGSRSVVMGYHANTSFLKSGFVYSDASSTATTTPGVAWQFLVRASGGVVFYTDSMNTMGVTIFPGSGSWSVISDKNKKVNFSEIDCESVLVGISQLKIKTWNYKSQSKSIRHVGPMAQDFYAVFHVGENNVSISSIDMDGVILAGIKGINNRIIAFQNFKLVDELKSSIKKIDNTAELNKRLDAIEKELDKNEF